MKIFHKSKCWTIYLKQIIQIKSNSISSDSDIQDRKYYATVFFNILNEI